MEKVKKKNSYRKQNSLKWRFIPYMIVMVLLAAVGLALIGINADRLSDFLREGHGTWDAYFYEPMISPSGQTLYIQSGSGWKWDDPKWESWYHVLNVSQYVLGTFWVIACMAVPGLLFYRRRLKPPLSVLMAASEKIGQNDLDFKITYKSKDEMGELCASFEKMRTLLEENQKELWRQMEDRKRLNAAFSHDLRTPLTVLKGQSEMILKYAPAGRMSEEKVLSTVEMMQKHILRLEQYTKMMNHLQKLEDIDILKTEAVLPELLEELLETGDMLRGSKVFELAVSTEQKALKDGERLFVDKNVLMQVFENLMANSVRYGKSRVCATLALNEPRAGDEHRYLTLTVGDDGDGFDENMLARAMTPFCSTEKDGDECHFGIGLTICKLLCEKHGGFLKIYNQNGGQVTAVFAVEE